MVSDSGSPLRRRWLVAVCVLGGAFGLAEVTLRLLDLPAQVPAFLGSELEDREFEVDDELFWQLAPNADNANAVGLTGWWPSGPKRQGELRIVCVGDSCTIGEEAGYEASFGVRLERLVQAEYPGISVRTVLLALQGYSTHQNRVLVEKYLAFLSPDITIFYCGPWNDFVPAVGMTDAEYVGGARLGALRLGRLVDSVLNPVDTQAREELVAAFSRGEAPHGRRVPLRDFRNNMRAMIDRARALDSHVVVTLPARPQRTNINYPVAARYNAALRDVTAWGASSVLDAQALFDAYLEESPEAWGSREILGVPLSICFADWIHPTALGHRLLAERLFENLQQAGVFAGVESPAAQGRLEVESDSVNALSPGSVVISGEGLDQEDAVERVWIGDRWIKSPARIGAGRMRLDLPDGLPSGPQWIEVSSASGGSVRAQLRADAPPLEVELSLQGDQLEVAASIAGPVGWNVRLWVSTARRPDPAATVYGPFHLLADPDGRPTGREEMPFRFELLQLPSYNGTIGDQGRWDLHETSSVDSEAVPDLVYAQAGIFDPGGRLGTLSEVVELRTR